MLDWTLTASAACFVRLLCRAAVPASFVEGIGRARFDFLIGPCFTPIGTSLINTGD